MDYPHARTAVIVRGNSCIAGMTYCTALAPGMMVIMQVLCIATQKAHRQSGCGTQLICFLQQELRATMIIHGHRCQCACHGILHVVADNNAIGFWSKMRFRSNENAKKLSEALHCWNPDLNPLYLRATSMCYSQIQSVSITDALSAPDLASSELAAQVQPNVDQLVEGAANAYRIAIRSKMAELQKEQTTLVAGIALIDRESPVKSPTDVLIDKSKHDLRVAWLLKLQEIENAKALMFRDLDEDASCSSHLEQLATPMPAWASPAATADTRHESTAPGWAHQDATATHFSAKQCSNPHCQIPSMHGRHVDGDSRHSFERKAGRGKRHRDADALKIQ